jgi:hypothetical protein
MDIWLTNPPGNVAREPPHEEGALREVRELETCHSTEPLHYPLTDPCLPRYCVEMVSRCRKGKADIRVWALTPFCRLVTVEQSISSSRGLE